MISLAMSATKGMRITEHQRTSENHEGVSSSSEMLCEEEGVLEIAGAVSSVVTASSIGDVEAAAGGVTEEVAATDDFSGEVAGTAADVVAAVCPSANLTMGSISAMDVLFSDAVPHSTSARPVECVGSDSPPATPMESSGDWRLAGDCVDVVAEGSGSGSVNISFGGAMPLIVPRTPGSGEPLSSSSTTGPGPLLYLKLTSSCITSACSSFSREARR
mmetsp:Transcript_12916/g.27848  ORF Transcript_12916/g.27848 Transcript_12916/m.27848 type:complete len:217 (+) Transcript_12916:558-1208(+)